MLIGRPESEIKCRSRPGSRFHPDSTALRFDGPLAERESKSVPGVFFSVQALEHPEYAALECRIYTRAVVFDGKHPIDIRPPG